MTTSRHRRHIRPRTTVIGVVLALALAGGGIAVALADGGALRTVSALSMVVAVAAGVLALDEGRVVEARLLAELSRERAQRTRDLDAAHDRIAHLVERVDSLDTEVTSVRSRLYSASRTTVIVAPDRRGPRIIEIPELVPADNGYTEEALDFDVVDVVDVEVEIDLTDDAADEFVIGIEDFPTIQVIGEFSLEGLSVFPRPAGMPTSFPSVGDVPATDDTVSDEAASDDPESAVIDLRSRASSRTA